jgi:hypothetical protein
MPYQPQNPVIVQGDKTVLLEVQNDLYETARDHLARFAELEKSPEYVHTYRITPLSLWNAAGGLRADAIPSHRRPGHHPTQLTPSPRSSAWAPAPTSPPSPKTPTPACSSAHAPCRLRSSRD